MSQGYSSNNSYQGRPTLCPAVQAGRYHYDGQVWWRNGREEVEWFVHCWETWNWRFYSSEEQADIGSLGCHLSLCDAQAFSAPKDQVWVLGSPEALVCVQVWDRITCHDCNQMSMVWASTRGHAAGFIFIWVAFADSSGHAVIQAKLHPGAMSQFVALMQLWSRLMSVGRVIIGGMGDVIPVAWALEKWSRPSLATSAGELFHLQGKLTFQWFEYWREGHNLHGPGRTAPYPTTLPPHQPHFYALTICNE